MLWSSTDNFWVVWYLPVVIISGYIFDRLIYEESHSLYGHRIFLIAYLNINIIIVTVLGLGPWYCFILYTSYLFSNILCSRNYFQYFVSWPLGFVLTGLTFRSNSKFEFCTWLRGFITFNISSSGTVNNSRTLFYCGGLQVNQLCWC
jgi:hypothetical protein